MPLDIRLCNIVSSSDFTLSYKAGDTPGDVNLGFTSYNGIYPSGTTEIVVSGVTFDFSTQYWFKITNVDTGEYRIINIYTHDSAYFDCVLLTTPTPTISPTVSITPTISLSVTPSVTSGLAPSTTPTISITPTITSTPTPTISVTTTITSTPTPTITQSCTCDQYDVTNNTSNTIQIIWERCLPQGGGNNSLFLSSGQTYTLCSCVGTVDTANPSEITGITISLIGLCPSGIPSSPTPTPTMTQTPTPSPTNTSYYYYNATEYQCGTCTNLGSQVVRSSTSLTIGSYYQVSNYLLIGSLTSGPSFTTDMDGSSGPYGSCGPC